MEEGNERADGKGYYLQAEDFMALDAYKEATKEQPKEDRSEPAPEKKDSMDELEELIDTYDLDIDLEDYDTYDEAKAAIDKAIKTLRSAQLSNLF